MEFEKTTNLINRMELNLNEMKAELSLLSIADFDYDTDFQKLNEAFIKAKKQLMKKFTDEVSEAIKDFGAVIESELKDSWYSVMEISIDFNDLNRNISMNDFEENLHNLDEKSIKIITGLASKYGLEIYGEIKKKISTPNLIITFELKKETPSSLSSLNLNKYTPEIVTAIVEDTNEYVNDWNEDSEDEDDEEEKLEINYDYFDLRKENEDKKSKKHFPLSLNKKSFVICLFAMIIACESFFLVAFNDKIKFYKKYYVWNDSVYMRPDYLRSDLENKQIPEELLSFEYEIDGDRFDELPVTYPPVDSSFDEEKELNK